MKYKITYEYRGKATIEDIEADTAEEAERIGMEEAFDTVVAGTLSLYDTEIEIVSGE